MASKCGNKASRYVTFVAFECLRQEVRLFLAGCFVIIITRRKKQHSRSGISLDNHNKLSATVDLLLKRQEENDCAPVLFFTYDKSLSSALSRKHERNGTI